ncbi:hemerythrin domain-containing protein [Undibacterium sp.]|uniref:hemerythrin domain-containing protein n=1 Tax=Undibacterium sp. TaxID=1914977 RepID=UPI002C8985F5|nr:hemerythrin domain-containing protein [Undibacterium sp.]HTD06948.1 hemerythrin domain-containing protein [Undibacterium sp.]
MSRLPEASRTAIRAIYDQHENLTAILDGMQHFVDAMQVDAAALDLKVFRAMLFYINEYPEILYHPNEDRYLFAKLRKRTRDLDVPLAELEFHRCRSAGLVRNLEHALNRYEFSGMQALPALAGLVSDYAEFYRAQMKLEAEVILPEVEDILQPEDWDEIDQAFTTDHELSKEGGLKRDFENMVAMIGNIIPRSIGVSSVS